MADMKNVEIDNKKKILSLSWRDIKSPKSGGAEIHTHTILSRANPEKYEIYHISMADGKNPSEEVIDGITYLRHGGILGVILFARKFYRANRKSIDYVIDQCNTHRFFTRLWVPAEKRIFYIHQLTREIWDIHLGFPWNKLGKAFETAFLKLQRKDHVITVSQSTKDDLVAVGFDEKKVYIVPNYITTEPWGETELIDKSDNHQFVYCGRYAKYKGIDVSIEALAEVKKTCPDARLVVVGKKDEDYVTSTLKPLCYDKGLTISASDEAADVYLTGFVSDDDKIRIMSESKCLLFPSIREGWGLIVTEAAVVGTPSIVFNAPGAKDAVARGEAGFLCEENSAKVLADKMLEAINDKPGYDKMRMAAYHFSKEYLQWGKSTDVIDELIKEIENGNNTDSL